MPAPKDLGRRVATWTGLIRPEAGQRRSRFARITMIERDSTRADMLIGLVITAWLALIVALVAWQASKGSLVHHVFYGFIAAVTVMAVIGRIRALRRYWPARDG